MTFAIVDISDYSRDTILPSIGTNLVDNLQIGTSVMQMPCKLKMFNALLHEGNPMYNFQLVHSKGQSIPTLSIYVQLVFAVPLLKTIQNQNGS